jgi:hypothetical protein
MVYDLSGRAVCSDDGGGRVSDVLHNVGCKSTVI